LLDKKIIGNRNIFVPLSYGEPHVMKKVSRAGYRRFGRQFKPLLEFLPKDEYNKIILKCGYVIMNHLRPQARGNIVTALWLGAKVFLNKETIYYKELQEKGLVIFPVSEIIDNPGRAFEKLSQSDIDNNRRILFELYNHDRVLSRTKKLVEIATTVKYN